MMRYILSRTGTYLGGSVVIKRKNLCTSPVTCALFKKEFLEHLIAQYKMTFKKYKNLKSQGIDKILSTQQLLINLPY